jgi:hypothetical protein
VRQRIIHWTADRYAMTHIALGGESAAPARRRAARLQLFSVNAELCGVPVAQDDHFESIYDFEWRSKATA